MKTYGGVDVEIHVFFTSALFGGEWSASQPGRFTSGERAPVIHWIGGWVGSRTGLDVVEERKFLPPPGLELRPLGCPASSQSPSWLPMLGWQRVTNSVGCGKKWSWQIFRIPHSCGIFLKRLSKTTNNLSLDICHQAEN
jgi:hypothetical protein